MCSHTSIFNLKLIFFLIKRYQTKRLECDNVAKQCYVLGLEMSAPLISCIWVDVQTNV